MRTKNAIVVMAILAMVIAAAVFAFPPQTAATDAQEGQTDCHPSDGFEPWAFKNLSIEVSPIDIDYDTCSWIGPIVDIPGDIHVNSTQDIPNNDAYTNLQISAGHISQVHRWYFIKNPTDYRLKVKLTLDEQLSHNLDHIIDFKVYINGETHTIVFNGTVETATISFTLQPMEVQEITFQISMKLSGKTDYTARISMQEYIQLIPDET